MLAIAAAFVVSMVLSATFMVVIIRHDRAL
jgi:hypothetical protein